MLGFSTEVGFLAPAPAPVQTVAVLNETFLL